MTQQPRRKPRAAGDEGALYTAEVMSRVKQLRLAKGWSAEQLAEEMAAAGFPWTRDAVVNLETGRRKRLAAHELMGLAYVLDVSAPVELLAPGPDDAVLPLTPDVRLRAGVMRAWLLGETGPLRDRMRAVTDRAYEESVESLRKVSRELGLPESAIENIVSELRTHPRWRGRRTEPGDGDGQD
ncbi:MAG: helix-turn-helix domain-containing protein [Streptosporangiaceae bacterium]